MSRAQRLVLSKLPSLSASFPVTSTLVMDHSASGFVDPGVVLQACHMIPAFSLGQRNPSEPGISALAGDKHDWREYYVCRARLLDEQGKSIFLE
jgi:hypothetical protein